MNNPLFQIRDFGDGTWSVIVSVWNPTKKFYEHPSFINLSKEEAITECNILIIDPITIQDIEKSWTYIGD